MGNSAAQKFQGVDFDACCSPGKRPERSHEELQQGAKVALAATPLFTVFGFTAYHTSVLLGDREVFFDGGGIVEATAFWSHDWCQGVRSKAGPESGVPTCASDTEVLELGLTQLHCSDVMGTLGTFFQEGSYDVLHKNCNSFSDVALYLLTKQRLGAKFNRLERWIVALEPWSTDLIKKLLTTKQGDATSEDEQHSSNAGYAPNPSAEGFNVEDLIGELRVRERGRGLPQLGCCGQLRFTYCCGKLQPLALQKSWRSEDKSPTTKRVWDPVVESFPEQIWNPLARSSPMQHKVTPSAQIWVADDAEEATLDLSGLQASSFDCRKMTGGKIKERPEAKLETRLALPPAIPPRSSSRIQEEDRVWRSEGADDSDVSPAWPQECTDNPWSPRVKTRTVL